MFMHNNNHQNNITGLSVALLFAMFASLCPVFGNISAVKQNIELPTTFDKVVKQIQYDEIGGEKGVSKVTVIDENTLHFRITFSLSEETLQDDWRVIVTPDFKPDFHWAPHLTPTDNHVIEQHVFRSPALILNDDNRAFILIPDLDIMKKKTPVRWYMDLNAPDNQLVLGMSNSKVEPHILFRREPGTLFPEGEIEVGFYIMHYQDGESIDNPFRKALDFLWSNWGHDLYNSGNPVDVDLERYVEQTYNWAFNSWAESVWQEFEINGQHVGAPAFIVNITQSPNYRGEVNEREFRSIWNQAWFSSLRSASGLYRYARRTSNEDLMEKALLTKELSLSFPKKNGFFYGLIGTHMHDVEIEGQKYNRSSGWDIYY